MVQSPEEAAALDKATIGEACGERAYIIVDAANWVLDEASARRPALYAGPMCRVTS